MQIPNDFSGIPFLDMDPAERTALIHKLYSEGKLPVPGAGGSEPGIGELAGPVLEVVAGLFEGAGEILSGVVDELF